MNKTIISKKHIAVIAATICIMVLVSLSISYSKNNSEVYADPASYESQIDSLNSTVESLETAAGVNTSLIEEIQSMGYLDENSITYKQYESEDVTIPKNGYTTVTITSDATKDGWTSKGVLGYWIYNGRTNGANSTYCTMNKLYLSGNTVTAVIRNTNTQNDAIVYVGCGVLFVKDE